MADMTIDELARRAGMTARNVRAYQDRGLLPPPTIVGRTGHYDERHLARLELIGRLSARGFSLAAISELLSGWEEGHSLARLLGVEEALRPFLDEQPLVLDRAAFEDRFMELPEDVLARLEAVAIIDRREEHWVVPSPQLLDAGLGLVRDGYPVDALLDEASLLRADTDRIARRFVDLWHAHVFEPSVRVEASRGDLTSLLERTERSREVPALLSSVMIAQAIRREIDRRLVEIATTDQH